MVFPREHITRIENRTGGGKRAEYLLKGAAGGALTALLLGVKSGDDQREGISLSIREKSMIFSIFFVPLGAVIGFLVAPTEQFGECPYGNVYMGYRGSEDRPGALYVGLRF
jgi:hypothetical protein